MMISGIISDTLVLNTAALVLKIEQKDDEMQTYQS